MFRISVISIAGALAFVYLGFSVGRASPNPIHWFGRHKAVIYAEDNDPPRHPVVQKLGKAEQATTRATTRAFSAAERKVEQVIETHERHKAEAATQPHPVKTGLREIGEGLGHMANGIIHRHPATNPAPTTQPAPVLDSVE